MSKKKNNSNQAILEKEETLVDETISVSSKNKKETQTTKKKSSATNTESIQKQSSKIKTETNKSTQNKKTTKNKTNVEKEFSSQEQKAEKEETKTEVVSMDVEEKIKTEDEKIVEPSEINDEKITETVNPLKEKKPHKMMITSGIAFAIILLLLFLFSTVFALASSHKSTIMNGIMIKNIDVSNLTKEQAIEKVSNALNEKLTQAITLKHKEYELVVFPEQFDISFSVEEAVDMAYAKGRNGNLFENNYEILTSFLFGNHINAGFSYSEDILDSLISEMETNFSDKFIESTYYIENNHLVLSKGKEGVVIDKDKLKANIMFVINNLNNSIDTIDIPTKSKTPNALDINQIYQEVYRAPKDAYYTKDPYAFYPHVDGIDFAISLEEANNLLENAEEECSIPLKVVSPAVTTSQIGMEAFPHLLGNYSTTFSTKNTNRTTNIKLATNKINGIIIMPSETFSYNQTVGQRTAAAGFKSAAVYAGGEVTTGIGGGICQVSSTLYNSVLLANLEIVERQNHGFNTGYVPVGRDATVSWGGPDFKFKNTRNYPIKVVASVSGGKITTQIFGLKMENEYDVEIQSYVTQYIPYKTIEKADPTLPKGQTKVMQNGSNGCKSVAYRILKQNSQVISKTLLSKDTYNPHNKIVAVGVKEENSLPQS